MPPKTKSRDSEREIQKAEEQFNKLIGGPLVTEPEGEEISNKLILRNLKLGFTSMGAELRADIKKVREDLENEIGGVREEVERMGGRLEQVEGAMGGGGLEFKKKQRALAEARKVVCFKPCIEGRDWKRGSKDMMTLIQKFGVEGPIRVLDVWETPESKKQEKVMVRLDSASTADYIMKNKFKWDKESEGREMKVLPWISQPFAKRHAKMMDFVKVLRELGKDDKLEVKSYIYYGESDLEMDVLLTGMRGYEMVDPEANVYDTYNEMKESIPRGTTRKRGDSSSNDEEEVIRNCETDNSFSQEEIIQSSAWQMDGNLTSPSSSSEVEVQRNISNSRSVSLQQNRSDRECGQALSRMDQGSSSAKTHVKQYCLNVNKQVDNKRLHLNRPPYVPDFKKEFPDDPGNYNYVIVECNTVVYRDIVKPMLFSITPSTVFTLKMGVISRYDFRDETDKFGNTTGHYWAFEMKTGSIGRNLTVNIHCYTTQDKFMLSGRLASPLWNEIMQTALDNAIANNEEYLRSQTEFYREFFEKQDSTSLEQSKLCNSCKQGNMKAMKRCKTCKRRIHTKKNCAVDGECLECNKKRMADRKSLFGARPKTIEAIQRRTEDMLPHRHLTFRIEDDAEAGEEQMDTEITAVDQEEEAMRRMVEDLTGSPEAEEFRPAERNSSQPPDLPELQQTPAPQSGFIPPTNTPAALETPIPMRPMPIVQHTMTVADTPVPVRQHTLNQLPDTPVHVLNRVRTGLSPDMQRNQQQKRHRTPYPSATDPALRQQAAKISMLEMEKDRLMKTIRAQERVINGNIEKEYRRPEGQGVTNNQTVKIVIEGKKYELEDGGVIKLKNSGGRLSATSSEEEEKNEGVGQRRQKRDRKKKKGREKKEEGRSGEEADEESQSEEREGEAQQEEEGETVSNRQL